MTADLEFVPPKDAQALEQVIQATGARVDAKIRKLMIEKATKEVAAKLSEHPSSPKNKPRSSKSGIEGSEEGPWMN